MRPSSGHSYARSPGVAQRSPGARSRHWRYRTCQKTSAARLVERHLLDPACFWLPFPPPSVSANDPSFSLDDTVLPGVRRYWRGPTWINAAWLLWLGLVRLGYESEAAELAGRLCATAEKVGLREHYHSYSGRGMGAVDFGWSSLALELLEPDPAAARSYL